MVQGNKILTVSYGTFSCTLEGFEDNFETMKAIAEYFRDLAADDRYFGAEPPTPDADMLARIAEKEIARRVEAHSDDQGILLRAAPAAAAATGGALAGAALSAAAQAQDLVTDEDAGDVAQADEPELDGADLDDADLNEADLDEADLAEDVLDDAAGDVAAEYDDLDDLPDAEDAIDDDAPMAEDVVEPVVAAATDLADDSVAAKLARIRAVVSGAPEATDEDAFSEDEHANAPETDADLGDAALGTSSLLDRVKSTVAAGDGAADVLQAAETETPVEDVDAEVMDEPVRPEPEKRKPVRVVRVKRGARKPKEAVAAVMTPDADTSDSAEPSSLSPEDEDALMRELAEVDAELDGVEEDALEAALDSSLAQSADDVQDTDEGLIEAADVPEDEAPVAPADPLVTRSIRAMTRRVRMSENATGKGGEQDVSRLMAEADAQMDEPEGRNRRSAIAHLRAAVAATKEERQTKGAQGGESREAQFREDLDAVRPNAMADDVKRAAPLKLVAEQRVDLGEDSDGRGPSAAELRAAPSMQSVRPRRVSARRVDEQAPATEPSGGFLAYAEEIGADGLPQLLEAAAAYMTLVEKRPQFSRPQLMSKVREVEDEDYSREDRLRYFGQLLREGKIEKTASGRFTASEHIGFRPDRAAG